MRGEAPAWARLATLPAPHVAELARQALEGAGIPAAVLGDQTGIFGPGFAGATSLGLVLLVPRGTEAESAALIRDLVDAFGGSLEVEDPEEQAG